MSARSQTGTPGIGCPVCSRTLRVGTSTSKIGRVALVLVCPEDGRHFRGFINDGAYVRGVLDVLERRQNESEAEQGAKREASSPADRPLPKRSGKVV